MNYSAKPRKKGLTKEVAVEYLRSVISETQTIYTAVINLNSHTHRYGYIMMLAIIDNVPVNISYYAGYASGMRVNKDAGTDFVRVPKGHNLGEYAVKRLQYALNEGVFMKVKLTHEWI